MIPVSSIIRRARQRARFFLAIGACALIGMTCHSPRAVAQQRSFFVIGATAGATAGNEPRFGPDVSLLFGKCSDSCGGVGPTLGIVRPGEYFLGAAVGLAYLGSLWADVAIHVKEEKVSGFHVSYGLGFALMAYGAIGYDNSNARPFAELGLNFKWPFL